MTGRGHRGVPDLTGLEQLRVIDGQTGDHPAD
jgi:hypothetical protein